MRDSIIHRRSHCWWQRSFLLIIAVLIAVGQSTFSMAHHKQVPEYHLKAVFLYNLVNFVSWPEERLTEERPFKIGVLGNVPFGLVLKKTVVDEQWYGKPIHVEQLAGLSDVRYHQCDLLFISSRAMYQWPEVKSILDDAPVLTVADSPSFTASGGMINLAQEGKRVVIEINRQAVSNGGLFISSKLLRLARIVNGEK